MIISLMHILSAAEEPVGLSDIASVLAAGGLTLLAILLIFAALLLVNKFVPKKPEEDANKPDDNEKEIQ